MFQKSFFIMVQTSTKFMGFVFNFEVEVFELVFVFDSKTVLRQEDHTAHSLD